MLRLSDHHSFFHSSSWARILKETYNYKPIYIVSFQGSKLALSIPLMEVSNVFWGKRGVSLPFTDQCAPFFLTKEILTEGLRYATAYGKRAGWTYLEWRDAAYFSNLAVPYEEYFTHDIDLTGSETELFSHLRESNRRNIRKSIKEGVSIEISQSLSAVKSFYRLHCITRKRHGLPPQPYSFFKNISDIIIAPGQGLVVSAFHSGKLIAASVFFHFGTKAIFKFGASVIEHQHLRPNNLVMWEAIKWYRERNFVSLNLGRTELDNQGLLQFKRMWAPTESKVNYYRYDFKKRVLLKDFYASKRRVLTRKIFARLPVSLLRIIGSLAYGQFG